MNALSPFFLLIQRPLVLFGAAGWFVMAAFLIGSLVSNGGDPDTYMDAAYLTVVTLSVYAGWVVGSCILELQQTTFAATVPSITHRLLPGLMLFAAGVVLGAVLPTVASSPAVESGWMLFAVGMAAFVTGSSLRDPQSTLLTSLGIALLIVLLATSGTQGRMADDNPVLVLVIAAGFFVLGLYRLINRDFVRSRSIKRGRPVLAFSLGKIAGEHTRLQQTKGRSDARLRVDYLGESLTDWLRAAWYETHGSRKKREVWKSISSSWALILIFLIEAREFSGELGFWRSLSWVIYDGLMRSPHALVNGEHSGAFIMVAIVVVIGGGTMALWRPVALAASLPYPLSRRQRSELAFAGSFLDMAILLFAVSPALFLLGHFSGFLAGIPPRFDYVPLFFRAVLVTLLLMPFVYWFGFRVRSASWRKDPYSMAGIAVAMSGHAIVAMVLIVLSGFLFTSAVIELLILGGLVLLSRLMFLNVLNRQYSTADLC